MIGQSIAILFGSFFVLLFAGVPISVGIGIASIITGCFFIPADIFSIIAAQRCFSGIDSFSLLALPFFSDQCSREHVLRRDFRFVRCSDFGNGFHHEPPRKRGRL